MADVGGLGRVAPSDWDHYRLFPLRTAAVPFAVPDKVEKTFSLSSTYRNYYDQGSTGACTGYSSSILMTILNRHRYDPVWLWHRARLTDEWTDNDNLADDSQGSSVRAALAILKNEGHVRVSRGKDLPVDPAEGVAEYRWASTVDEIRAVIAAQIPVVLGINWYSAFDRPQKKGSDYWAAFENTNLGSIRGGHAICVTGASDRRSAVRLTNSWGVGYPIVWVPYAVLRRLIHEEGEAGLVTDR